VPAQESGHGKDDVLASLITSLQGPFVVLRNHLREKQERVDEALKAVRYVTKILSRMGAEEQVGTVETELKTSLRFGIQEWYQETYREHVMGPPTQTDTEIICALSQVSLEGNGAGSTPSAGSPELIPGGCFF